MQLATVECVHRCVLDVIHSPQVACMPCPQGTYADTPGTEVCRPYWCKPECGVPIWLDEPFQSTCVPHHDRCVIKNRAGQEECYAENTRR